LSKPIQIGPWKLWPGRKVRVFSAIRQRDMGVWSFIRIVSNDECAIDTPEFRQGKKIIRGWSCWWIPESEHQGLLRERNHRAAEKQAKEPK